MSQEPNRDVPRPALLIPVSLDPAKRIEAGDITIDMASRQAALKGQPISLKPREFDLLAYLSRHPGIVLTREALLREVWGYEYQMNTRTVDVHIRWLRQKLEDDPALPTRILTVRGHGYRLMVSNETA